MTAALPFFAPKIYFPTQPRPPLWEYCLILAVCLTPIYGGGGAVFLILCGPALVWAAWRKQAPQSLKPSVFSRTSSKAAWIFAAAVTLYLGYFWIIGYWVAGLGPFEQEHLLSNLPLLVAAGLGLCLPEQTRLEPARIGQWAMWATLITTGIAFIIYGLAYGPPQQAWVQELDIWGGQQRLALLSRNPVIFSICLVFLAFLAMLGLDHRPRSHRFLTAIALVSACLTLVAISKSRGPVLAFILVALAMLIWSRPNLKKTMLYGGGIGLIALGLSLITPSLFQHGSAFFSDIQNSLLDITTPAQNALSSNNQRKLMYEAAFEAWQAAPWIGYGYEARFSAILPYLDLDLPNPFNHAHQMVLNHMVAGGIGGVVVLTFLILSPFAMLAVSSTQALSKRPAVAFAAIVVIGTVGSGMTTAALGHFIHATSLAGLLLLFLAMLRSAPFSTSPSVT